MNKNIGKMMKNKKKKLMRRWETEVEKKNIKRRTGWNGRDHVY